MNLRQLRLTKHELIYPLIVVPQNPVFIKKSQFKRVFHSFGFRCSYDGTFDNISKTHFFFLSLKQRKKNLKYEKHINKIKYRRRRIK